jgi:hypothetical protein
MPNPSVKDTPKIKQLLLDFMINNNTNTELCNLHVQYNLIIISNKYFNLYPISTPKDVLIPQTVQNFYVELKRWNKMSKLQINIRAQKRLLQTQPSLIWKFTS